MRDRLVFWAKLSTVPITVGLWYLVYRAYRRSDDDDDDRSRAKYFEEERSSTRSAFRVVHIRVPKRAVGAVIGKAGSVIRGLQDSTRARITFVSRDVEAVGEEEEILIRGLGKNVDEAERQILKIISNVPQIETEEIRLHSRYIGPLIGRNGENIRSLMSLSNAKIDVERTQRSAPEAERVVTIRGSREQILLAKQSIAKLQEEIDEKERKRQSLACTTEELPITDQPLEVLVSVVKNPNTLFLQLTQTCYALDPLVQQLTRYYAKRQTNRSFDYKVGNIVAAVYDGNWHRARIAGCEDGKVDVDFVDYGDAAWVPMDEVRPLTEKSFLTLPFQAIEVGLYGAEPAANDEKSKDLGSTYLEDITYFSKGVRLLAKVVSRNGPIPTVRLFDPNHEGEDAYDINEMMIRSGHCIRVNDS